MDRLQQTSSLDTQKTYNQLNNLESENSRFRNDFSSQLEPLYPQISLIRSELDSLKVNFSEELNKIQNSDYFGEFSIRLNSAFSEILRLQAQLETHNVEHSALIMNVKQELDSLRTLITNQNNSNFTVNDTNALSLSQIFEDILTLKNEFLTLKQNTDVSSSTLRSELTMEFTGIADSLKDNLTKRIDNLSALVDNLLQENLSMCRELRGDERYSRKDWGSKQSSFRKLKNFQITPNAESKITNYETPSVSPNLNKEFENLSFGNSQMEEEFLLEPGRLLHFSPQRTSEEFKTDAWSRSNSDQFEAKIHDSQLSDDSTTPRFKTLTIPWNGRILSPTISQLKEFQGDLDLIERALGSREPKLNERNFKIRFTWRNFILWPTADQLKLAKGDLNILTNLCPHKLPISPSNNSFRTQSSRKPSKNSLREF